MLKIICTLQRFVNIEAESVKLVADYFGVTADELLSDTDNSA